MIHTTTNLMRKPISTLGLVNPRCSPPFSVHLNNPLITVGNLLHLEVAVHAFKSHFDGIDVPVNILGTPICPLQLIRTLKF